MKTVKCAVCGRTQPDVNCKYSRRQTFGWFRFDWDSQDGVDTELDVCEECYEVWVRSVKEAHNDK